MIEQTLLKQRTELYPEHQYINNDKSRESLKTLLEFKELIQEQLPKMPEEYITRIVFDFDHQSLVLFYDKKLIAGCCYKVFEIPKLVEIVFLVVDVKYQTKGHGSQLIRMLKNKFLSDERNIQAFITCADDNAVEFFRRQGFNQHIESERYLLEGFIKDYEGSKKMECLIDRKVKDQFEFDRNLQDFLEHMKKDFKKQIDQNQRVLQINESTWNELQNLNSEQRVQYLKDKNQLEQNFSLLTTQKKYLKDIDKIQLIIQEIVKEDQIEIFMDLVKKENVPEYYDLIKNPISFNQIIQKTNEQQYKNFEEFEKDILLICSNAKEFNNDFSIFHKKAIQLEKKYQNLKKKFVQLICQNSINLKTLPKLEPKNLINKFKWNKKHQSHYKEQIENQEQILKSLCYKKIRNVLFYSLSKIMICGKCINNIWPHFGLRKKLIYLKILLIGKD